MAERPLATAWEGDGNINVYFWVETEPDIKIIDVLQDPQAAEDDKIIATPTLVKEFPQPLRKMIGDLSNTEKVLMGLGLPPKKSLESNGVQ
jgi:hypothetical protein